MYTDNGRQSLRCYNLGAGIILKPVFHEFKVDKVPIVEAIVQSAENTQPCYYNSKDSITEDNKHRYLFCTIS